MHTSTETHPHISIVILIIEPSSSLTPSLASFCAIDEFKENNLLSPTDEDSDCDESSEKDQIPDGDKAEDDTQGTITNKTRDLVPFPVWID